MVEKADRQELLRELLIQSDWFRDYFISPELLTFGDVLGENPVESKKLYLAVMQREVDFSWQPREHQYLIRFDWASQPRRVRLQDGEELVLDCDYTEFVEFIGQIDAVYSEVYPLGSVVELDRDWLPEEVADVIPEGAINVFITARKMPMDTDNTPGGHYYFDYFARVWPIGEVPDTQPMTISNLMIKRLVFRGFESEEERDYRNLVIDAGRYTDGRVSSAFVTLDTLYDRYHAVEGDGADEHED